MATQILQSDCFHINKTILYYVGLWPKKNSNLNYQKYSLILLLGLFFLYIALEAVKVWKELDDVIPLVNITLILLTHVVMVPKVFNFSYYIKRIDKLTRAFDGKFTTII